MKSLMHLLLILFLAGSISAQNHNYWVIYSTVFHGCGYIVSGDGPFDPHAVRGVYQDCKTYQYNVYWTGSRWAFDLSAAKHFSTDPATNELPQGDVNLGIDFIDSMFVCREAERTEK